jgi:imidazolonepropionase-like amidohydrolase
MTTLLKVAQIIHPDGTTTRDYAIAIDNTGSVIEYVHNSQLGSYPGAGHLTVEDESSCTLMPLLADGHTHLGISDGLQESSEYHTEGVVKSQLEIYLQAGVGHVLSLGLDQSWVQDLSRKVRETKPKRIAVPYSAGCGFGAVDGWPPEFTGPQLRFRPTDVASAEMGVRDLAARGIRTVKIWVDDFGGRVPSLPQHIAKAIVDEAHDRGLKVCAHVFSERDARDLITLKVDALAHSVRDKRIDRNFAEHMAEQGVKLMPTLVREEAAIAFSQKDNPYLDDPLFRKCAGPHFEALAMEHSAADPQQAEALQRSFDIAVQNLEHLSNEGVEICLGTDSGFRLKLPGFSQHRELQLMCQAGLTPAKALAAGLKNNYEFFAEAASDLKTGRPADFVLLSGDPLADIRNTGRIRQVRRQGIIVGML